VPVADQKLLFKGKVLEDTALALMCGIPKMSVLMLVSSSNRPNASDDDAAAVAADTGRKGSATPEDDEVKAPKSTPKSKVVASSDDDDDDDDDGGEGTLSMASQEKKETKSALNEVFSDSDDSDAASDAEPTNKPDRRETLAEVFGSSDSDDSDSEEEEEVVAKKGKGKKSKAKANPEKKPKKDKPKKAPEPRPDDTSEWGKMLAYRKKISKKIKKKKRLGEGEEDLETSAGGKEVVKVLMEKMTDACKDDDDLRKKGKLATKKLKLLPYIVNQLRNVDLTEELKDANILQQIGQFLVPDSRNQLTNIKIRDALIDIVYKFFCQDYDIDQLEESRFGRVLMALKSHKDESRENKKVLQKMYNIWAKQANRVQDDLTKLSKQDRRELDEKTTKKRRRSEVDREKEKEDEEKNTVSAKIGEEGFIQRARVPQAITRDYTKRPKSKVEVDLEEDEDIIANLKKKSAKKKTKFDAMQRKLQNKKNNNQKRNHHASNVHLSGNK